MLQPITDGEAPEGETPWTLPIGGVEHLMNAPDGFHHYQPPRDPSIR
jgi:hypothetical protein